MSSLCSDKKHIVLAFRGSVTFEDYKVDFDLAMGEISNPIKDEPEQRKAVLVHDGFQRKSNKIWSNEKVIELTFRRVYRLRQVISWAEKKARANLMPFLIICVLCSKNIPTTGSTSRATALGVHLLRWQRSYWHHSSRFLQNQSR
jgi:hypothetical protein